jgi:hypothetical protein
MEGGMRRGEGKGGRKRDRKEAGRKRERASEDKMRQKGGKSTRFQMLKEPRSYPPLHYFGTGNTL